MQTETRAVEFIKDHGVYTQGTQGLLLKDQAERLIALHIAKPYTGTPISDVVKVHMRSLGKREILK